MATTLKLTAGQMVILRELHKNGRMRWSEFDDRDDVTELVERGLVEQVGGARLQLSEPGVQQAERLAAGANGAGHGNGSGKGADVLLSVNQRDTLFRLYQGEAVRGKGVHFVLDSLRQHDLIRMGVKTWEPTPLGMQRLIDAGLITALPEPDSKRDTDEMLPVAATEPDEDAGDGSARVSLDDGKTFGDMSAEEIEALDAAVREASAEAPDVPETTVLINGVQFTLPLALDLSDATVRERVLAAIEQALSPTVALAAAPSAAEVYFADPTLTLAQANLVSQALRQTQGDSAGGCDCLHRRVLDELMALSPTARALYDAEAAKDALRAKLDGV